MLRLLEGYHDAGVRFGSALRHYRVTIVRQLCKANMHHLVLKGLQRVEKTGLFLRDRTFAVHVFRELHMTAALSEFSEEVTAKMLRFSEQCIELLEEPLHRSNSDALPGDPRTLPDIISIPAALAAARAKKQFNGQDEDGKVKRYASRLMEALQQEYNAVGLHSCLCYATRMPSDFTRTDSHRSCTPLITSPTILKENMPSMTRSELSCLCGRPSRRHAKCSVPTCPQLNLHKKWRERCMKV